MNLKFQKYGKGKTVLLLHAFPFDQKMWEFNLQTLLQRGYKVMIPELLFDPDKTEALSDAALEIAEILETENINKAVVCGISMGGYVALNFYDQRPDLCAGLILCDTNSTNDSVEKRNSRFQLIEKLKTIGNHILLESVFPNLISEHTKNNNEQLIQTLTKWILSPNVDKNISALKAMANRKNLDSILNDIKVPTKLIYGSEDQITNLEVAEKLHQNIFDSELSVIPDSAHLPNLEQPELFNAEILDFLDKIKY